MGSPPPQPHRSPMRSSPRITCGFRIVLLPTSRAHSVCVEITPPPRSHAPEVKCTELSSLLGLGSGSRLRPVCETLLVLFSKTYFSHCRRVALPAWFRAHAPHEMHFGVLDRAPASDACDAVVDLALFAYVRKGLRRPISFPSAEASTGYCHYPPYSPP